MLIIRIFNKEIKLKPDFPGYVCRITQIIQQEYKNSINLLCTKSVLDDGCNCKQNYTWCIPIGFGRTTIGSILMCKNKIQYVVVYGNSKLTKKLSKQFKNKIIVY